MNLVSKFFGHYGNFQDRTRRRDFFTFVLINDLMFLLFLYADGRLGLASADFTIGWLSGLWTLFMTIPNLAIIARRMHDIGRSGWWMLLGLIPVLSLLVFFWMFRNSDPGTNPWGSNPKTISATQVAA